LRESATDSSLRNIRFFPYISSSVLYAIFISIHGVVVSTRTWLGLTRRYGEKNMIYVERRMRIHPMVQSICLLRSGSDGVFLWSII